mgnify:CR=1 FL=1
MCDHQPMSDPLQTPPSHQTPAGGEGLYPVQGIVISTMLCSLAAAIFMLYSNYQSLGNPSLARKIAFGGGLLYLLLISASSAMTPNLGLAVGAMVVQGTIAYFLASALQGEAISYHREHGGLIYSNFRAIMVGFITGFVLLFALVALTLLYAGVTGDLTAPPAAAPGVESGLPT